jgi:hypothetical protein
MMSRRRLFASGAPLVVALTLAGGGVVVEAVGDPLGIVNVDPNGIFYTDNGTCPKADVEITLDTGCYQGRVVAVSVLVGQASAPVAVSGYGDATGAVAVSVDNAQAYGTDLGVAVLGDAGGSGYDYNIYQCSSPSYAAEIAVAGTGTACGSLLAVSGGSRPGSVDGAETRAWSPNGTAVSLQDPTYGGAVAVSGGPSATTPNGAGSGSNGVAIAPFGDARGGEVALSVKGTTYACGGPEPISFTPSGGSSGCG